MPKTLYNEPSPLETRVVSARFGLENSERLDSYLANEGFKAFLKAREMTPEAIVEEVKASALRGRGGAGFPTGMKWSCVPRMKPPFPAVAGAWASPTLLNNVETFSAIPFIIREGGKAFADLGTPKNGGTRLVCISGHVNKPGVYELPLGFNMTKAINEVAGGLRPGRKLKAVVPGGSSCPLLRAEECDIPMDYDTLAKV